MITCQKHLFNLDSSEYYLNCAYKSPLLKKGELLAINAIKKERTPSNLKPNNYFEISEEIRKEFSKIIKSHKDEVAIMPSSSYGFANIFSACFYAAADMVSVNIKLSLIQIATPNHLRGRVSTVNGIFISSSNEVDDVRAGSAAALFGPVAVVVIGGVVAIGMRLVVRCFLPNCAG